MTDTELSKILDQVSPTDLRLDENGRIVIENPKLAEQLKGLVGGGAGLAESNNYGCCTNGVACRKTMEPGEMVSISSRLAGGR